MQLPDENLYKTNLPTYATVKIYLSDPYSSYGVFAEVYLGRQLFENFHQLSINYIVIFTTQGLGRERSSPPSSIQKHIYAHTREQRSQ